MFGATDPTRSLLLVPLKLSGKMIGVISAQHYAPNVYTAEHLQIINTLANQVAIALERARLIQSLRLQAAALDAAANAIVITDQAGLIQ
jgi:GAF domain-containing protein